MSITLHFSILSLLILSGFTQTFLTTHPPQSFAQETQELFESEDILSISLSGDMRELLKDKSDDPQYYPLQLSYKDNDGSELTVSVQARARGNFRRLKGNCSHTPLLIKFSDDENTSQSVFKGQTELKLVMPCKGEEYVIREWLVYKIYNLITPKSFRARLVKVQLEKSEGKSSDEAVYGILLENEDLMAERNSLVSMKRNLKPYQTQKQEFLNMAVFQYLIGNTDWSVQYLQNIKLVSADNSTLPYTVPYDFDHAGIVDAPYALPAKALQMKSVRQRRYRGYCIKNPSEFESTIALYNSLKKDIYNIYINCPLLDEKYLKSTIAYLDDFYETLQDEKSWQKEFSYPCDPRGTGNVVIKGMKGK